MIFPTFLIMASALFPFAVAFRTKQHVRKRSNLPLLFHGLGDYERETVGRPDEHEDMKERSANLYVNFAEAPEGYKLVQ